MLGAPLNQKRSVRLHSHKDRFLMHWSGPIPKHTTGTVYHGDDKVSIMISSPCPFAKQLFICFKSAFRDLFH